MRRTLTLGSHWAALARLRALFRALSSILSSSLQHRQRPFQTLARSGRAEVFEIYRKTVTRNDRTPLWVRLKGGLTPFEHFARV